MEKKPQNTAGDRKEDPAPQGSKWPDKTLVRYITRALVLLIVFVFSFISYLSSFATYSLIDNYLIQPYYKKEAEANNTQIRVAEGETLSFENDELDDDDDDAPKYVYVNGKLVDRKILKEESVFSDETKEHLN